MFANIVSQIVVFRHWFTLILCGIHWVHLSFVWRFDWYWVCKLVCIGLIITSSSLEANNGMNGISLWSHVIVRKFAQKPGFQPVLSGYLSLIITPPLFEILRSGEKIRTKEPSILVISESQWTCSFHNQQRTVGFWAVLSIFFMILRMVVIYISQNQFSEFLRTVRPKNGLNKHQGFDAISGTRTTPVTRHQEIPIYFSHESWHFCFTLPTKFTN